MENHLNLTRWKSIFVDHILSDIEWDSSVRLIKKKLQVIFLFVGAMSTWRLQDPVIALQGLTYGGLDVDFYTGTHLFPNKFAFNVLEFLRM